MYNMTIKKRKLQINQLESRVELLSPLTKLPNPPTGWIRALRLALGMSMQQLANKLGISKQGVRNIEIREQEESITIKSLKAAARAMDMELVYGFVPREGSLDAYLDSKAQALAQKVVLRTSTTMRLEDQEVSKERLQKAIHERTILIKNEIPKALWD